MWFKVLAIVLICIYIIFNAITAKRRTARQMYTEFISGQCTVGKIFANIFYAPAWVLKGIRYVVLAAIA